MKEPIKSSTKPTKKRKKKNSTPSRSLSSFNTTYFPLLLAGAGAGDDVIHCRTPAMLRRLLRQLRREIDLSSESVPASLLSLLPLLLSSRCPSVRALSAELAGQASLKSAEQNEIISSDGQILKGLIHSLTNGSHKSALNAVKAALNAVMDLSVSSLARQRLREAGIVHKILKMWRLHKIQRGIFGKNKLLNLFLETATTLINTSNIDFTERISPELIQKILPLFSQIVKIDSNHKLAETIFRLSINLPNPAFFDSNELKISIFGRNNSSFDEFLSNYWEKSPFLIKRGSDNSEENNTISIPIINKWRNSHSLTNTILIDLISCSPISSDELNINNFLNEIPHVLTSPLKYNQDIKIVKTEELNRKIETHFPSIQNHKQAFNEGFSIALKGMQLRNDQVALVSLALSEIFGLPSIGVNLYLSPHGAQGLAGHFDDHCVLVWQVIGSKMWRVLKDPIAVLPRLYEPLNNYNNNDDYNSDNCEKNGDIIEVLLEEGDILYIPRGYFHEARTEINASCSLHLTLAIEVDRPFEWEGFVHVALQWWCEKLKQNSDNFFLNSKFVNPNLTFTVLLHISIKLIGNLDPTFRKACLVASNYQNSSQKSFFDQIISKIDKKSNFLETFSWIQVICEKRDEDSLQCLRWLRHLDQNGNEIDFCNLLEILEKYVVPCRGKMDEAMEEFENFKGYFCKCVVYEDVHVSFVKLLEKYRKVRGQYLKGMLGLHRRY